MSWRFPASEPAHVGRGHREESFKLLIDIYQFNVRIPAVKAGESTGDSDQMARLTDPDLLAQYKQALSEWKVKGAVELQKDAPEGLRMTLEGVTVESFKEALFRFVCEDNGEIDQVKETRDWEPCNRWEYHYDLRPTINGVRVYVETRLYPEAFGSHEEPEIHVVHIKPA